MEGLKLKEQVLSLKSMESIRLNDISTQLFEKQNHDFLSLAVQNDILLAKNAQLSGEIKHLLVQIESQQMLTDQLKKENHFLRTSTEVFSNLGLKGISDEDAGTVIVSSKDNEKG